MLKINRFVRKALADACCLAQPQWTTVVWSLYRALVLWKIGYCQLCDSLRSSARESATLLPGHSLWWAIFRLLLHVSNNGVYYTDKYSQFGYISKTVKSTIEIEHTKHDARWPSPMKHHRGKLSSIDELPDVVNVLYIVQHGDNVSRRTENRPKIS